MILLQTSGDHPLQRASAVAVLSCLSASCGFLPHDNTSIPFPGDGAGNFGPSAPVELCLGTARIVAPSLASSGAAAVCIREDAQEKSCNGDTECDGIEQ